MEADYIMTEPERSLLKESGAVWKCIALFTAAFVLPMVFSPFVVNAGQILGLIIGTLVCLGAGIGYAIYGVVLNNEDKRL